MNLYCVICTYTTPDGRTLKAATNNVPAASSGDAAFNVMDALAEKGASAVTLNKVTQTGPVRPPFDPSGLPTAVIARATTKAAASWCYVTPDGGTFYVSEPKARAMLAANGGSIFPPITETRTHD